MIRVGYMSDLHLEFELRAVPAGPPLDALAGGIDLLVIAGDTNTPDGREHGCGAIGYAARAASVLEVPVVTLAGNHEFYGADRDRELATLRREAAATKGAVRFLENDGVRFDLPAGRLHVLGCSLWTDFALFGDPDLGRRMAGRGMNDFQRIRTGGRQFAPADAEALHHASRAWLGAEVARRRARDPDAALLIATHHAPSRNSLPSWRRDDPLSPAYASEMAADIADWCPSAWIHGHCHGVRAYRIAGVPVVSAARGYVGIESGAARFVPRILTL